MLKVILRASFQRSSTHQHILVRRFANPIVRREVERDKEFAAHACANFEEAINPKKSFSDGVGSRGRAASLCVLHDFYAVASEQNCIEHSERFHLIFSRIHSRVLFL
jgi:hypothetical protein